MEALCAYGDSSDGSGSESESDNSEGNESSQVKASEPVRKSKLPSAAELFGKSHKAAFLAHAREPAPEPEETKQAEASLKTPNEPAVAARSLPAIRQYARSPKIEEEPVRSEHKKHSRGNQTQSAKSEKPETNTAKDRVKRQRIRGQAGIGSDFRTWKSDEEMRMRQQFDT